MQTLDELFQIRFLADEIADMRARLVDAGPRTKAILLANIDINNRAISAIERKNVVHVDFKAGRK